MVKNPQVVEITAALHYDVPHNLICSWGFKPKQILLFGGVARRYEEVQKRTGYRGAM